jgi:hypothetical protein
MWFNYSSALTAPCHSLTYKVSNQTSARPPTCLVLQALIDIFPSCIGSIPRGDNNFDDSVSDRGQNQTFWSLFDDKSFPSVAGALSYDKATYNFDLSSTLSPYLLLVGFVRSLTGPSPFANYIRKMHNPLSFLTSHLPTDTSRHPHQKPSKA